MVWTEELKLRQKTRMRYAKEWCVQKLGEKCHDCGIESKNYEIYDFHHIRGRKKKYCIETLKWLKRDKIPSDVILLCANCHRIRTQRIMNTKSIRMA